MDEITAAPKWEPAALAEYQYWQIHDKQKAARVNVLIESIYGDGAFVGVGKPEPLKYKYHGYWSRRIDQHHRLIYRVSGGRLYIRFCGKHYED